MHRFAPKMSSWTEWPIKDLDFKDMRSVIEDPFFCDFLSVSDLKKPAAQREKDWTIRLDVRGFKPENVNVKVSGEKVIVDAEQKDGDDYTVIRRHFPIADGVDVNAINSKISPNGVLVVSCPHQKSECQLTEMQKMLEEFIGPHGLDEGIFERQLNDDHKKQLKTLLNWGDVSYPSNGVVKITKDDGGNKNYEIGFNLKQYEPDEIKLKLNGYKLLLDAKHVEDEPNHHVSRVIHKSVTLPETIDTNALRSILRPDGVLRVQAPLLPESAAREIPISFGNMIEKE